MSVKVFSTDTCPWCDKAKEYLSSLNIEYDVINVAKDKAAAMELVKKTRQMGVPVIQIGEKYIIGYDQLKISDALKEAGLLN